MKSPSFRIKVECPTLSLSLSPLEFPLIGPEGSEWQMDVRFLPEPPHVPSVRILRRTDTVSAPRYFILRPLKSRWETGVRQERVSGPVEGVPGWERDSVSSNVWLFVVYRPPYPTPHPQPIPRPFLKNALLGPTCKVLKSNVSLRYNDTVFILNKTLDSSWYRLVNPFVTRFSKGALRTKLLLYYWYHVIIISISIIFISTKSLQRCPFYRQNGGERRTVIESHCVFTWTYCSPQIT